MESFLSNSPLQEKGWRQHNPIIVDFLYLLYYNKSIDFEFDPRKSAANKVKHGIDFVWAQALWGDDNLYEIQAVLIGEARWAVVGSIGNK